MKTSEFFREQEFKNCVPSCSLQDMDQEFMNWLDTLRLELGIPLVLNCAYRSVEWDKSKGRTGNSAHTRGKAVDIRCFNSHTRWQIITTAIRLGCKRFAYTRNFVHLDMDDSLPQEVVWVY